MGKSHSKNEPEKEEEKETLQNPFEYPFIYMGDIYSIEDISNSSVSGILISNNCVLTSASAIYKLINSKEVSTDEEIKEESKQIEIDEIELKKPNNKKINTSRKAISITPKGNVSGKSLMLNQNNSFSFPADINKENNNVYKGNEDVCKVEINYKNSINLQKIRFKPIRTKEKPCLGDINITDIFIPDEFLRSPCDIKNNWAILKLEEPIGIKIKNIFGRENNFLSQAILSDDLYQFEITIGYKETDSFKYYESNMGSVRNCEEEYLYYIFENYPSKKQVGGPILVKLKTKYYLIGIHCNEKSIDIESDIFIGTKLSIEMYQQIIKTIEIFKENDISKYEDLYSERYYSFVTTLVNIGSVCETIGNFELSLEYYQKAFDYKVSLLGENHISTAVSYNNIGLVYKGMNKSDEAIENLEKALKITLNLLGENHISSAKIYSNLGLLYEKQYKYELSFNAFEKALNISLVLYGKDSPELGDPYYNYAMICFHMGKHETSNKYFKKVLKIYKFNKTDNITMSNLYSNLANNYNDSRLYDKALKYFQKSLDLIIKEYGDTHLSLSASYNNLGIVYKNLDNHEKALNNFEKSIEIQKKTSDKDTIELAKTYNNIGGIHFNTGNHEEALNSYEKAIKIKESISDYDISLSTNYNNLGLIYKLQGNFNQAIEYYEKSLKIKLEFLGEAHPSTIISYNNLGEAYKAQNNDKQAKLYFDKAKSYE